MLLFLFPILFFYQLLTCVACVDKTSVVAVRWFTLYK
jgi:hypothetical protein